MDAQRRSPVSGVPAWVPGGPLGGGQGAAGSCGVTPPIGPQVGSARPGFAFHRLSLDGGGRSRGEEGLV